LGDRGLRGGEQSAGPATTRVGPVVLFFGGNMVWMALTFGMLLFDAQTRI
jgi:hypothetical protein